MASIFLSHSSVDEREAVALNKWLTDNGWDDVFLDIDPQRGLAPGDRWQKALRQAADRCEAVICVVSPAWVKSTWCVTEFYVAKSLHKRIFAVVLKEVPIGELPTEMTSEWQLCRLIGTGPTEIIQFRHRDSDDSIAFLAEGLNGLKTGLKKAGLSADFFHWPPKGEPQRSPFRGLEPLDFEDAAVFFGRDLEILRGLDALRGLRDNPATRLFVILAASGTGKSSFLRAGLLPRLARDDRHFFPLSVVRPETLPISGNHGLVQSLARCMEHLGISERNPGDLMMRLSASGAVEFASMLSSIQEAARVRFVSGDEQSSSPAPTLVLPVDQAEELFNADAGPEARKFLSLISEILRDAPTPAGASSLSISLIVAFTIRSDRYEPLQTAPELAGLKTTVFDDLKPMSDTLFREVITGPIQRASTAAKKIKIEPDLVKQLVKDCATGADTLPLLSLTLERLYRDYGSDGDLRLDHYLALGGMGNIIKDKIEKVLDRDSARREQQLALLRTAFIPSLVTINPQNDEPMRRLARRSHLLKDSLPLVDALVENRLLISDQRHNETVIEVAHEALLRQWDTLSGWLQDERVDLKEADALERQSREWKDSGYHESWLWVGQRLQHALDLARRSDFRNRLESCSEFLERSRKQQEERDADKLRVETDKRKAAEKLAAAQAAARQEAERAAARAKRQFKIAVGLALVAAVAALAAFLFYKQANDALEEQKRLEEIKRVQDGIPDVTADVFKPMDGGIDLSPEEIIGRNNWNLWCGYDEHFWNQVAQDSFGLIDLLKMLDNRKYGRGERFQTMGLLNQPGFRAATGPDRYGLWLDEQIEPEPGKPDQRKYGKPSGVLGFRLFLNPEFNNDARKKWDGTRFMTDPTYYNNNKLVRPYSVGVTCGACHIGLNPINPPIDPENPRWENLASGIGNQYIREGKVFACNVEKGSFFYEELAAQPPGTSDISRIASDNINNPSAIYGMFLSAERALLSAPEKMAGGTLALPGQREEMAVAHIGVDGADSIGKPGAMLRAYLNIGMNSNYWRSRRNLFLGLVPQRPFEISYAFKNTYTLRYTVERLETIAGAFRRLRPFHLADAPGGQAYITQDEEVMTRGKKVFAEACAACHSSKQPPPEIDPHSGEGKAWFRAAVMASDFLENNFLSNDKRYPLTKIETNSARAFGSNAMAGHIWDNFSSWTYKELSPVDELEFYNPFDEAHPIKFQPKLKHTGPGYYRVPSLVSVWSSAPFLHNNALGKFTNDPSVNGRLDAYNDAAEKLFWPEKRLGKASICRTQRECDLYLRKEFLPKPLQAFANKDGYVKVGPIPKGTPINLIANLEPDSGQAVPLLVKITKALQKIHAMKLPSEQATAELIKAVPELLAANKCPDFIEDKGHYFGTDLPDDDKRALIEYMKTF
jgi:hypothetical protein